MQKRAMRARYNQLAARDYEALTDEERSEQLQLFSELRRRKIFVALLIMTLWAWWHVKIPYYIKNARLRVKG
jgi:hypothetical protein